MYVRLHSKIRFSDVQFRGREKIFAPRLITGSSKLSNPCYLHDELFGSLQLRIKIILEIYQHYFLISHKLLTTQDLELSQQISFFSKQKSEQFDVVEGSFCIDCCELAVVIRVCTP